MANDEFLTKKRAAMKFYINKFYGRIKIIERKRIVVSSMQLETN